MAHYHFFPLNKISKISDNPIVPLHLSLYVKSNDNNEMNEGTTLVLILIRILKEALFLPPSLSLSLSLWSLNADEIVIIKEETRHTYHYQVYIIMDHGR